MLKVTNMAEVFGEIDLWLKEVEAEIVGIANGLAYQALITVEHHSAQFSGDFAANWNLSVNIPDTSFQAGIFPGHQWPTGHDPFIMGDAPAMQYAYDAARGKLSGMKLGDTIWLTNAASHQEAYAEKIEAGRVNFRRGNDGMPIFHTVQVLMMDYKTINKGAAQRLLENQL